MKKSCYLFFTSWLIILCCMVQSYAKLSPHEREYFLYSDKENNHIQAGLTLYSFTVDSGTNDFWSDGSVGIRNVENETISSRWTYEACFVINKIGDFSFAFNYFANSFDITDNQNKSSETYYRRNSIMVLYDIKDGNDYDTRYIHGLSFEYLSFRYKDPTANFTIRDFDTQHDITYNSKIETSDNIFSLMYYYDGALNKFVSIFSRRIGPQVLLSNITYPFLIYDENQNYSIETLEGKIFTIGLALGLTQYAYIDWFIVLLDADIYYGFGKLKTDTFSNDVENMYLKGEIGVGFRLNNYRFIISGYIVHSETSFLPTNRSFKYGEPSPITLTTGETGFSFSNNITF